MRKEFAPRQFKKLHQFFLWFAFAQKKSLPSSQTANTGFGF